MGKKYIGYNLSLRLFFWKAVFLGTICLSGNYAGNKSSKSHFSLGAISRGILSGGNYLQGAMIQEQSSRGLGYNFSRGKMSSGEIVWGPFFLGGNCPGSNNQGGNHPGDNCPGGSYPGGYFSRGAIARTPLKSDQVLLNKTLILLQ